MTESKSVKRILILWADDASPNLGVRVLGRGTAALANRVWPEAEIVYQNYGHRAPELPFGRLRSLLKERVTGRLGMQPWLAGFDLAIDTRSGDSFADIYGLPRLATMGAVAELVSQAGVPIALGPQTIGPFTTRRGVMLARRSLARAGTIMARDPDSATYSARLGHPVDVLTTDVVFALPSPVPGVSRDVILNISGLLWNPNPHVESSAYREAIRSLHEALVAAGRTVTFLAHVLESDNPDNDVPAIHDFVSVHAPDAEVLIPSSLDDVRSAVFGASVVIASRMHACLNSLSVGTPAIPLAYSRKFEPLLRDLGWEHTVDLRTNTEPAAAVMKLVAAPSLERDVPEVIRRAHATLLLAEDALRDLA